MIYRINHYGLYFYCKQASDTASEYQAALDPYLRVPLGADWMACLQQQTLRYRELVDALVRDSAETSQAIKNLNAAVDSVGQWRHGMYFLALQAGAQRAAMIKASGRGLGRVETPKQCKEFLARVDPLVEQLREPFLQLGAMPQALEFPHKTLARLEELTTEVKKEKADDTIARSTLGEQREALVKMLNTVETAAKGAASQIALFTPQAPNPAERVVVELEKALGEALVQARARSADKSSPAVLSVEEPVAYSPAPSNSA